MSDRVEELEKSLRETLRSLEAHLTGECAKYGLGHATRLCPCWDNEVKRARTLLGLKT